MIPQRRFRWLERGLLILGILLLGYWSDGFFEARGFQSAGSRKLDAARRETESRAPEVGTSDAAFIDKPGSDRPKHAVEQGSVLGRIEIPRLHLTAIVAEGVDMKTLGHAVGHVPSTALPGRPGNCALAGHRDSFLRGLGGVRVNDVIRLVTSERTYNYEVEWSEVVDPHRVDVLDPTTDRSLTLITCYPFVYVGHAPKRFIVRARQVEAVAGL